MKIEVQSTEVTTQAGLITKGPRQGQPYSIRKQVVWVYLSSAPYPVRAVINLDDNAQPYPVGNYELSEQSFYVDKFGSLALGRLHLIPLATGSTAQLKTA